jgi:hypothetical protein
MLGSIALCCNPGSSLSSELCFEFSPKPAVQFLAVGARGRALVNWLRVV